MRAARWVVALAAASVVLGVLAEPASASGPAKPKVAADSLPSATYPMPFQRLSHLLVDGHGHVFLTGGTGTNGIVVRQADGSVDTTIVAEQGPTGMVLSADGTTLYVGLYDAHAISAIDTTTLTETHRYTVPATDCPGSVAVVGTALWYGPDCDGQLAGLGRVGLATGTVTHYTGTQWFRPNLLAVPGDPSGLLIAETGYSPSAIDRTTVSGSTLTVDAAAAEVLPEMCENGQEIAIDPDGTDLIAACGAPYHPLRLRLSDLALIGTLPADSAAVAVATSTTHGGVVATGTLYPSDGNVLVYRSGSVVRALGVSGAPLSFGPAEGGLAWSSDGNTLYAVEAVTSGNAVLHVVSGAATSASTLTITGPPTVNRNQQLMLSGTLNSGGAPLAAVSVEVSRKDLAGTVDLGTALTDAGGAWKLPDTEVTAGVATYTATYAGDGDHAAATASAQVTVAGIATTMTMTTNASYYTYGQSVSLTVHLSTTYASPSVALYDAPYPGLYRPIATAVVNSSGNAFFHVVVAGRTAFLATFAGNALYSPSQVSRTVLVYGRLGETFGGAYRSSGGVSFVHRTVNPTMLAQLSPYQSGCLTYQLEQKSGSSWVLTATSACFAMNSVGQTAAVLTGTHRTGVLLRMRAVFAGSTRTLATSGAWHEFEFTT